MELELSDIVIGVLGALFTIALGAYKTQQDRRYKEDQEEKKGFRKEIDTLKFDVLQNKERDISARKEFDTYKNTINGSQSKTERILEKIEIGIDKLNDKVQESINLNQTKIDNLREEFLSRK